MKGLPKGGIEQESQNPKKDNKHYEACAYSARSTSNVTHCVFIFTHVSLDSLIKVVLTIHLVPVRSPTSFHMRVNDSALCRHKPPAPLNRISSVSVFVRPACLPRIKKPGTSFKIRMSRSATRICCPQSKRWKK